MSWSPPGILFRGQSRNLVIFAGRRRVFHSMEKLFANFPQYGKIFSTVWKTSRGGRFM
jgi:hypothetical protein